MLPAALLALPVALAASGSLPPLERNLRHRDLARSATSRSPVSKRTLEPKAGSVPLGGYEVVGNSGVSAQMMFLGTADTVYILDSECKSFDDSTGIINGDTLSGGDPRVVLAVLFVPVWFCAALTPPQRPKTTRSPSPPTA